MSPESRRTKRRSATARTFYAPRPPSGPQDGDQPPAGIPLEGRIEHPRHAQAEVDGGEAGDGLRAEREAPLEAGERQPVAFLARGPQSVALVEQGGGEETELDLGALRLVLGAQHRPQ